LRTFFLYWLLSALLGNPIIALIVLFLIYLMIDRRFIGLLPDFTRPFRQSSRLRRLRTEVELNPANAGALLELGMLLFDKGRYQEALPFLEKAGKKLDDHATAQFYLGAVYVRLGRLAEGRQILEKAVALRPNVQYGEPYIYLAEAALHSQGKEDLATITDASLQEKLEEWIEAVSRYGNVEILYRMGRVLLEAGKRDEAGRLFNEAMASYRQAPAFSKRTSRRWALRTWWTLKQM